MVFLYALSGVCAHLELPDPEETLAERYAHRLSNRWATPHFWVRAETYPAICGKLLGYNYDVPLLVPLGPLQATDIFHPEINWSVEVLSSSKKLMFMVRLSQAIHGEHRALMVTGPGAHGQPDQTFASIDETLAIRNGDGVAFGKLAKDPKCLKGEYVLEEVHASQSPNKWVLAASLDPNLPGAAGLSLTVTWRPKGRILATVACSHHKNVEYLQVMNSPGVDMVLALTCALGVIIFDLAPRHDHASAIERLEETALGMAARLLERFQF